MLTNDLYPFLNANSEIVYRIAMGLVDKYGYDVSILGYNSVKDTSFSDPPFKVRTIRMKSVSDYCRIALTSSHFIQKLFKLVFYPRSLIYYIRSILSRDDCLLREYQYYLKKIISKESFDCIISFSAPKDTLLAVSGLNIKIPFIAYKLDPWSTNYQYCDDLKQYNIEREVDKCAKKIVVTNLIKKDYLHYASKDIIEKIETMEFPNIINYGKDLKSNLFNDDKIHCVFAGGLYKDIRNPEYTIELFERMNDERIVFHILGYQSGGQVIPNELPRNIVYHGQVSSLEAIQYMKEANILVNIGNTILNQMPSKILTYISLGKPILNIIKSNNCPTLSYLKKYPLSLSILEDEETKAEKTHQAHEFIIKNYKESLPFKTIETLYKTCTNDYVCKKMDYIIKEVVDLR